MKLISAIIPALLVSLTLAAPTTTTDDEKVAIDNNFFPSELIVYTAEHEVISLTIPLNSLNFDENEGNGIDDDDSLTVFFVEAEPKPQGGYEYKGVFKLHERKAKLILANGHAVAASNDNSKLVFIGASDGIYVYDAEHDKSEKYGTLTDSILDIAKENSTDVLYIVTHDHFVYKVTEGGNKKTKLEGIQEAYEIILDFSNNLYFLGADKMPYIYTQHGIKHYEGLPAHPTYGKILRPPFVIDDGIPYISDDKTYIVYSNGTYESADFEMKVKPSAYGMEGTIVQYFAFDKKIYEYNILALFVGQLLEELKPFLNEQKENIESIATRKRSNLYQAQ